MHWHLQKSLSHVNDHWLIFSETASSLYQEFFSSNVSDIYQIISSSASLSWFSGLFQEILLVILPLSTQDFPRMNDRALFGENKTWRMKNPSLGSQTTDWVTLWENLKPDNWPFSWHYFEAGFILKFIRLQVDNNYWNEQVIRGVDRIEPEVVSLLRQLQ